MRTLLTLLLFSACANAEGDPKMPSGPGGPLVLEHPGQPMDDDIQKASHAQADHAG